MINITANTFDIIQSGLEVNSQLGSLSVQNFANAVTSPSRVDEMPYRRHMAIVSAQSLPGGWMAPKIQNVLQDYKTPFQMVHRPYHPAANAEGMVLMPNINTIVETTDYQDTLNNQSVLSKMQEAWMRTQRTLLKLINL